jgi:hypothetical protein
VKKLIYFIFNLFWIGLAFARELRELVFGLSGFDEKIPFKCLNEV